MPCDKKIMLTEREKLIRRCDRWKNSLLYYLSLPATHSNVEMICHCSTYLVGWLSELRDYDEDVYEDYLLGVKHLLNRASSTVFDHFYSACKRNSVGGSAYRRKYVASVGALIEHMYCILWCSYYAGNEEFIDHVYDVVVGEIASSLPPTSGLKGRSGKRVGRAVWELLAYFEKFLDYDIPSWAIQKFQTRNLTKPKITEDETYNIMSALDSIELSNPNISDDAQYRFLRSELLTLAERGARERKRILKTLVNQKCVCGSTLKLARSDVVYSGEEDSMMLVTTARCKICGRSYNVGRPVEKTKVEFDVIGQLDQYLDSNYGISLIAKMQKIRLGEGRRSGKLG